jgi:catechol 2,3-dioxygenase-like lactoylglutathione lyase family enzyme
MHAIFYTKHSKEMYDFLKDVLGLRYVDAGNGRLFFAAPPTELAVHDTDDDPEHELWLICDDIGATVQQLEKKGIKVTPVADRGWAWSRRSNFRAATNSVFTNQSISRRSLVTTRHRPLCLHGSCIEHLF